METFCLPFPGVKSNLISFNSFLAFLCNKKDKSWWNTARKRKKKTKGRKPKENRKARTCNVWRWNKFSAFQWHVSLLRRGWRNSEITQKGLHFDRTPAQFRYILMNINWTTNEITVTKHLSNTYGTNGQTDEK